MEAVVGLLIFVFDGVASNDMNLTRKMVKMIVLAAGVSLASFFAMTINNTSDNTYFSYVVSMIVWVAAAYCVARVLGRNYGNVTIELVANYVIVVSCLQAVYALLNDMVEPVRTFTYLFFDMSWMESVDRLYGFGYTATLDTGGIRFALASVLCAFMLTRATGEKQKRIPWYLLGFLILTVLGNMVARTTLVGSVIGLAYILFYVFMGTKMSYARLKSMAWLAAMLVIGITVCTWLYNTNEKFHANMRFGFEGFFSLVEEGKWDVASNNTLESMYVLPDNPKTWFIGDGHFIGTTNDPNYIGQEYTGYYMGTDIGYLRFIFYFGMVGLVLFSWLIIYASRVCMSKYKDERFLFATFLLMNFIIWFKVATDLFFVFALFYTAAYYRDNIYLPKQKKELAE